MDDGPIASRWRSSTGWLPKITKQSRLKNFRFSGVWRWTVRLNLQKDSMETKRFFLEIYNIYFEWDLKERNSLSLRFNSKLIILDRIDDFIDSLYSVFSANISRACWSFNVLFRYGIASDLSTVPFTENIFNDRINCGSSVGI